MPNILKMPYQSRSESGIAHQSARITVSFLS